jgi:lipopolysaccharide biosynthesis glycosyltransferase
MNICIATDNNYSKYAGVLIASILYNNKNDVNIFILDGGIDEDNKNKILALKSINDCEITFVPIDNSLFEEYKKIKTHDYINVASYYPLRLASLLPNIDKVIYLDCDMVVNSDMSELYNTDIQDYYSAGVLDTACQTHNKKPKLNEGSIYVNSGMILYNLSKIRQDNIEEKFLEYTKNHYEEIFIGDQQIINVVLQGHIKQVGDEWNVQSSNFINRSLYTNNPKIVHYIGRQKPWIYPCINYYKDLYFKYLQMTEWKQVGFEKFKYQTLGQILSIIVYIIKKPFFLFRPRFYKAFFQTYIAK